MENIDYKNWIPDQVGNDNFKGKKLRVAIGMSGGVDSSVAAKILKDQGYEVVGFMMKLWPGESCTPSSSPSTRGRDNACCDIDGLQDAKRIAAILDIPFYVVDVREKFKEEVADYFIEEYKNMRTPNPCVKCNEKIKFGWLLDFAKSVGCDYLATGHYARIASDSGNSKQIDARGVIPDLIRDPGLDSRFRGNDKEEIGNDEVWGEDDGTAFHLLRGKDENKDQSYFLYRLNQDQLKHILFPIGEYTKDEVRAMAKKWNLPVYEKKESQEICFIQEKDYREFLRKNISEDYFKPGEIVDSIGNVIGRHQGLINYTIGQRRGIEQSKALQIPKSKLQISNKIQNPDDKLPLYVIGFNKEKNQLIVGEDKNVYQKEMIVGSIHAVQNADNRIQITENIKVKIRYRHPAVEIKNAHAHTDGLILVNFKELQRAVTSGQSAVFYDGDEVLGGGIIQ